MERGWEYSTSFFVEYKVKKLRIYIFIGIILTACSTKQSPIESSSAQADEIRQMSLEDSFDIDTNLPKGNLSINEEYKKTLTKLALRPLKPNYNVEDLNIENAESVFTNLLHTIKKFADSSDDKQKHLDTIFMKLDKKNEKIQRSNEYPIELKLKIASIKSDIHFLHSNRQLRPK